MTKQAFRALSIAAIVLTWWSMASAASSASHSAHAVFAGGCFWGMEAVSERVRGVTNVVAGYAGGTADTAHYDDVSTGSTGHAESIEITYDPTKISYRRLLDVYFSVAHDPTQLDRQGPDSGPQYRSAIFYTDRIQRMTAEAKIRSLTAAHVFARPVVTQVVPLTSFYAAESYHQHFYDRHPTHPYILQEDVPKVHALETSFPGIVDRR